MSLPEQVKTSTDLAVFGTAATINIAVINEWVTLVAGVLAIAWSVVRIVEWLNTKPWLRQRPK